MVYADGEVGPFIFSPGVLYFSLILVYTVASAWVFHVYQSFLNAVAATMLAHFPETFVILAAIFFAVFKFTTHSYILYLKSQSKKFM